MSLFRTNLGWAALPARLALGITFLLLGSQKLFGGFGGPGLTGTAGYFGDLGIQAPVFWAWVVALVEFLAGAALIVGLLTRLASLGLTAIKVVGVILVTSQNGFFMAAQGKPVNGYAYDVALLGLALCLLIGGGGKASIDAAIAGEPAEPEAPAAPAAPPATPPPV